MVARVMTTLPTITVWQPWAHLIAIGAKPLEFRGYAAPARYVERRIAVHAGMHRIDTWEMADLYKRVQDEGFAGTGLLPDLALPVIGLAVSSPESFPRGVIVCTAILGQPIRDAELADRLGTERVNDSDRDEHSNWGWPLSDIQPIPNVPARGKQGWWAWTIPPELTP